MGLFSRKKARPQRPRAEKEADRARRAEAAQTALSGLIGLTVVLALYVGFRVGVPRLEAVASRAGGRGLHVAFEWPQGKSPGETWLPPEIRDELMAIGHQELDRWPDPFSAQGLRGVSEALTRTGWFDRVRSVERESDGVIRISATWREPAAVVRCEGIDYLVGRGAEVLPLAYQRGGSGRPAIVGAQMTPPKSGGRITQGGVWPGNDVKAGLDLLRLISTKPWRDQVAAVDVGEYLSKHRLVLVSKWNGRTVWGGAPDEVVPGEVPSDTKLRRIDVLVKEFGQVDAKRRIVEVAGPILLVDDTATANAQ